MLHLVKKQLRKKKSQTFLSRLAVLLYTYTKTVLVVFLLATLVFASFAVRLEQQTSVRDLLPVDNSVVQRFEETVRDFDLIDRVVVVVQFDPAHLELAESFAEIFVEKGLENPQWDSYLLWLKANLFDSDAEQNWHHYLQYLTRLIPRDQVPALLERLSAEGVDHQVKQNRRDLERGLGVKSFIEKDPLYLMQFASTYSKEVAGNFQLSFTDGFLVSKDRDMLLILGKPKQSPENVSFSVAITSFLKTQVDAAMATLAEEEDVDPQALLQIGLTGPHAITAKENEIIQGDVINMFVTSFAMVLLLFVLAYGRPMALLYVGIPLLCAEIWTLGIGYLLFGRLNLLTATFSAVIVGLGIDYAIHIFSRYLDERALGFEPLEAMQVALSQTGLGTFIGGLTTALAFLAMGISNFSGLREFAIIAACGICLCMLANVCPSAQHVVLAGTLAGSLRAAEQSPMGFPCGETAVVVFAVPGIYHHRVSLGHLDPGDHGCQFEVYHRYS